MRGVGYDSWLEAPYQEDARAQAEAEAIESRTCVICKVVTDDALDGEPCAECEVTDDA